MALVSLQIPPGIDKETPSLTSSPAWRDCDKVRFKSGQPEKIGGWQATQAGAAGFLGVARSIISWRLNNGLTVSALGTHKKLYLYIDSYIDITPLRSWAFVPNGLNFVLSDATVTVNHTAHGASTGQSVRLENAAISGFSLASSEINKRHAITVVDANSYTFELSSPALATSNNDGGANLIIHYDFEVSPVVTNPFDIVNTSTTLTVNHSNHGASIGDYVTFVNATDLNFDDPSVNTNHEIISVIDGNSYTVEMAVAATATTNGVGGSVTFEYEIPVGNQHAISNFGFGAGGYGLGTWGTARALSTENADLRHWSLDFYGEDLVACPNNGRIYSVDSTNIFNTRAQLIANSPDFNDAIVVTNPDRHLVALASSPNGTFHDKMLVRWADQETIDDWVPIAENTAGDQILSGGSRIFKAERSQSSTLIWTDGGLYAMEFQGPPFTFGFNELGRNCGAVSYECVATHNSVSYWMSDNDFFIFDGVVRTIPCTVHTYVFDDLNKAQASKVFAGLIKNFHEVIWFYPSANSLEIDRYVIYNFRENLWYVGTLVRTCWVDSELHPYPLATDDTGIIYHHEFRDDNDGTPMDAFIESAEFDIGEGDKLLLANRVIPDMGFEFGNVEYTLKYRRYPHAGQLSELTQTIDANTTKIDVRMRARQIALRVSSNELRDRWFMGVPRIDVRPDGRR